MVPSVLPWVPLPLPGAPKRINVLYLIISELRLYSSKGAGSTSLVISSEIEGSRRIIDLEPTGSFDPEGVRGSRRRRDHQRVDVYPPTAPIEPHGTVKQRKNRVVTAQADVFPWRKLRAALAHYDIAGDDHFAAEFFHTQPFADAVAPVLNTALSFFVSHWGKLIIDPPSPRLRRTWSLCLLRGYTFLFVSFLRCAFFRSYTDAFNFHARQFAAMPNCPVITFPPLVLERDNLPVPPLFENFSRHFCSRDERIAVRHIFAIGKH